MEYFSFLVNMIVIVMQSSSGIKTAFLESSLNKAQPLLFNGDYSSRLCVISFLNWFKKKSREKKK